MIRTIHQLTPTPRWTIYWLTLAAPEAVRALFADVSPLLRGVEARALVPAGIRLNPWHLLPPDADHLDLIRVTMPAARVARATGVPLSRIALFDGPPPPEVVRALRGASVELIADRARVVDPRALDLTVGRVRAATRVEAWLLARTAASPDAPPTAVAVGTDPAFALAAQTVIDDWNGAYAYPRFAVGDGDEVIRGLRTAGEEDPPPSEPRRPGPGTRATNAGAATVPEAPVADTVFLPLSRLVSPEMPTLAGVGRGLALPVSGMVVFNPSPFGRSGPVLPPDGIIRVVTDVPGTGYAFVPDTPPPSVTTQPDADTIDARHFRVRVDRSGGGVVSLIHHQTATELVARGGVLNGLPDAVASELRAETIDGVGARLVARRMTPRGPITTTISVYDALPWVELENRAEGSSADPVTWTYAFDHPTTRVGWEVPGGMREQEPPVTDMAPIRWSALYGPAGALLLGTEGHPMGEADDGGRLVLRGPCPLRVRIGFQPGHTLPDDPWRFGFAMYPLVAVPATGRGTATLPSFGRMLDVGDPLVAVLAVQPATDAVGVMVFLQDVGGPPRDIIVRPGVVAFERAWLTDLAERDTGEPASEPDGGIRVPIETSGYAAVRLLGVRLAV